MEPVKTASATASRATPGRGEAPAWVALCLTMLAGCGDPMVSADYRGEPIFLLNGVIESVGPGSVQLAPGETALVSMFWSVSLSRRAPRLLPQDSVTAAVQFPSTFEVRFFDPPEPKHLVADDGRYGVGLLLAFVDADGDLAFDPGERLIGGSLDVAIIWASETIPPNESPFARELPSGFSLIDRPFATCMRRPPRDDREPLVQGGQRGPSCASDATCPEGLICQPTFRVCVPKETLELVIVADFDLSRVTCRDP
jgi:hypothetical protein